AFRVVLCTDNRLMSNTSITKEMALAVEYFGLTLRDLEKITINAMKSAFIHYDDRIRIIYDVLKPGYIKVREGTDPYD
ncbi:MAG: adenosine deaminase, partial [Spirochaetales bacterium]|nr:adenosine deaminase [Spirochaetales bacterium]